MKYQTLPICPAYHPSSDLGNRPGYYPNINENQLSTVNELSILLEQHGLDINVDEEMEFLKLLRFLRARKFNVQQAFEMIKSDIEWRKKENINNLRIALADEVLDCNAEEVCKSFPTFIKGFDFQKRPVSWRHFGKFEIWNIVKLTSIENLVKFHAWECEQCLRLMYKQTKDSGYNVETFVIIADADNWGLRLATSDAFAFIKGMATTDSDHYPERLGTMMIINAPYVLSGAWRIIQTFLDDVTKSKIKIYSDPSDWQPELFKLMSKDDVPRSYGGNAPDLTLTECLQTMNPSEEYIQAFLQAKDIDNVYTSVKVGTAGPSSSSRLRKPSRTIACQTDESYPIYPEFPQESANCTPCSIS